MRRTEATAYYVWARGCAQAWADTRSEAMHIAAEFNRNNRGEFATVREVRK